MFQPHLKNICSSKWESSPQRGVNYSPRQPSKIGRSEDVERSEDCVRMAFVKFKTSTAVLCFWTWGFISFEKETRKPMERNSDKILIWVVLSFLARCKNPSVLIKITQTLDVDFFLNSFSFGPTSPIQFSEKASPNHDSWGIESLLWKQRFG